ncbi:MAG: transporter substrate-binding domain-containing protein [Chloroflexota bacterium]
MKRKSKSRHSRQLDVSRLLFRRVHILYATCFIWGTFILGGTIYAQEDEGVFRVAVNPVEPFIFLDGDKPRGFSVDLWDAVATEANLPYEFVPVANVTNLLKAVEANRVDLGISATSITAEREQTIDFTLPFFSAGLQIMTQSETKPNILTRLGSVFTPNLLGFIFASFATLLIVAHIAWLIERKTNPVFQGTYFHGIWTAFYWTVVTASTVGYGDAVLRDNRGRLLAVIWMLLSLFLVSYFTATVTTSLTLEGLDEGINGPEDLRGSRIVTLKGTTSAAYLTEQGIVFDIVSNTEVGMRALLTDQADALVYDAPVLQYYANLNRDEGIRLVPVVFQKENYGIVLPQGSPIREQVNQALLHVLEDGTYDRLRTRWFGASIN